MRKLIRKGQAGLQATVGNQAFTLNNFWSNPSLYSGVTGSVPVAPTSSTPTQGMIATAAGQVVGQLGGLFGGGNSDSSIITSGIVNNLSGNLMHSASVRQGLNNFTNINNLGNLGAGIGTALLDKHTKYSRYEGKYGDLSAGTDIMGSALGMSVGSNPLGSLGMAAVNKITGGTSGMTAQDALLGSSSMAGALTAVNPLLGVGYITLSGLNSALGHTTGKIQNNDFFSNEKLNEVKGSYNLFGRKDSSAQSKAGKKYGFTSNSAYHGAKDEIAEVNRQRNTLLDIYDRQELGNIRGSYMSDLNNMGYRLDLFGGYNQYGTRVGKKGMKLPSNNDISRIRKLLQKPFFIEALPLEEVPEFKEGGVLEFKDGGQMNVIPEGALHARKNNMEGAGVDFTHKGIPVIDKEGEQQAEIERDEIIFRKEVTSKLEELMKDGSDKAAIEAGRLLVEEIFENTEDRTGLIASIIGEEPTKEEIDKMQEGGPLENKPSLEMFIEQKTKEITETWTKEYNTLYNND